MSEKIDDGGKENNDPNVGDDNDSQMSDNEIFALVKETVPKTTKRSTDWGMRVFKKWLNKRMIAVDFHTVTAQDLAGHLRKFYAEVKKSDGGAYSPSALTGIRAAIQGL